VDRLPVGVCFQWAGVVAGCVIGDRRTPDASEIKCVRIRRAARLSWLAFRKKAIERGSRKEAPELQARKPGYGPGLHLLRKGGSTMILMLVIRLAFVGRLSALVVWTRKGQR